MEAEFNLIATCSRNREFEAIFELKKLLSTIGDAEAKAWESNVKGLIFARTSLNPFESIEKLRELARSKPWEFNAVKRVIPIEYNVETSLSGIAEVCREKISSRIKPSEKFRVTLEKRRTNLSRREIIQAAAEPINSPVDLENPQRIVLIEIVGGVTGISLLKSNEEILNVTKEILRG